MNNPYFDSIEGALTLSLQREDIPETLRRSMEYSLIGGGKRIRGSLCLAVCDMLGGDIQSAMPLACGIEMIQAYSLIHDDLPCMDDDDMRRGKPSSHKVFGEAGAVLAGDALLTYAFEWMLSNAPDEVNMLTNYIKAVSSIAQGAGATGMVAGQSLELSGAIENNDTDVLTVESKKTGAPFVAACVAGALAADASFEASAAEFGRCYGAVFQLTDDILDAEKEKGDIKNAVTVFGEEAVREKARALASNAAAVLAPFGDKAAFLLELLQNTLVRSL